MEFWLVLLAVIGCARFLVRRAFKVPDGAIARRDSHIFRPSWPGWYFNFHKDEPQVIDLPSRIVSIPKHRIRLFDNSEVAVTLSIVWKPDPRNIETYLKYETAGIHPQSQEIRTNVATIDGLLIEWVKDFLNEWGMDEKRPHTLRQALSAKRELQEKIFDKLKNGYRIAGTLGIIICNSDSSGRGGINITEIEPLAKPDPEKWGDDGNGVYAAGKRLMQKYQDITKTCQKLYEEFPDQAEEIEDFRYCERIRLKEKS